MREGRGNTAEASILIGEIVMKSILSAASLILALAAGTATAAPQSNAKSVGEVMTSTYLGK